VIPDLEAELAARLALNDDEFTAMLTAWISALPPRRFTPDALAHALGYPWARPARSYVLHDDAVELIDALAGPRREAVLNRFVGGGRTPLLAIGSNGAPDVLRRKFAHFERPDDRDVLVVAGHLHDFDVGASATVAVYGAMPATLFPSPGAAARTAILWLTAAQFTQLVWSEVSYMLGTLDTRFSADEPEFDVDQVIAFVSRFGAFWPESEPAALAAIPARARTAPALSQRQLLGWAAALALGAESRAEDLVRAAIEDMAGLVPRVATTVWPRGVRFASPRWTPLVTSGITGPGGS
jgi:hypothetical protein